MTRSSHTYRELAAEYESTEDYRMWHSERLDRAFAMTLLGEQDMYVSLRDEEVKEDIKRPRIFSMMMEDHFIVEGMLAVPQECGITISKLVGYLGLNTDSMPVCMARRGTKDIVFTLSDCVFCESEKSMSIYIPMTFVRKVYYDLKEKDITCFLPAKVRRVPYYRANSTYILSKDKPLLPNVPTRPVTGDHQPMHQDGYTRYGVVNATIYISLEPQRTFSKSGYGGDRILNHNARSICISVLSVESQSKTVCNDVAEYTSNGSSNSI
jgi:hypothetical protein